MTTINWLPQPRQLVLLRACGLSHPFTGEPTSPQLPVADVFGYGGSAGGGKTDTLLAVGCIAALTYPRINIGYFRREFPQLEGLGGAIPRSLELWSHIAKYNQQQHRWTFPTEAHMQFLHCKDPKDVYNYQSQQFDILLIDESTQFLEEMVDYLITRNRATITSPTFKPFAVMATNPGNIGHMSFRSRFAKLPSEEVCEFAYPTGIKRKHFYVPSKLRDNEILLKRDPSYADRLATNEKNRRILLEGDWDGFEGQVLTEWRQDLHVIKPFKIPVEWNRYMALDWGVNKPFSTGWYTDSPDGRLYKYRQIYMNGEDFRVQYGSPLTPKRLANVALGINKQSGDVIKYVVADPSMWNQAYFGKGAKALEQGESIAEVMTTAGLPLIKADNDRINGLGRFREWLSIAPDGLPWFQVFETCTATISELPALVYDQIKVEDVDTTMADHAYDETRYMMMSRPSPTPQKDLDKSIISQEYHRRTHEQKDTQLFNEWLGG